MIKKEEAKESLLGERKMKYNQKFLIDLLTGRFFRKVIGNPKKYLMFKSGARRAKFKFINGFLSIFMILAYIGIYIGIFFLTFLVVPFLLSFGKANLTKYAEFCFAILLLSGGAFLLFALFKFFIEGLFIRFEMKELNKNPDEYNNSRHIAVINVVKRIRKFDFIFISLIVLIIVAISLALAVPTVRESISGESSEIAAFVIIGALFFILVGLTIRGFYVKNAYDSIYIQLEEIKANIRISKHRK